MKEDTATLHAWDVLIAFGFQADSRVISDLTPGLSFDFGNFTLSASAVTNQRFAEVVMFTGILSTSRTMSEIIFEIPRRVASQEQCAAWLAWNVDKYYVTDSGQRADPDWLTLGRKHQHLLPWVADSVAYSARPYCSMDRDSARLVLKKLRAALLAVRRETEVSISFDGEVMKIRCGQELIAAAATGKRWEHRYRIEAAKLAKLPGRLMQPSVALSFWENCLTIANKRYSGVTALIE